MTVADSNHGAAGHDHHGAADHDHHGVARHEHGEVGGLRRLARSHSHDHAATIDDALLVSRAGTRALGISLVGLLVTAAIQAMVFVASGSVGLLADTIHNFADAFTALPIGMAFVLARRPPNQRYTYGYGRAEDLAGLAVVVVIAVSAITTAWEAVTRLIHPQRVTDLGWVAAAGVVGFLGNELAGQYRIRVGRRIGSAALVADGHHARADGCTSLAVVIGAAGVAVGWRWADPMVGVAITLAILGVLRSAARDVYRRLMDAVDPALVDQVRRSAAGVDAVEGVDGVRVRWVGHELRAELNITVDRDLHLTAAHAVAETVRHELLHRVRRLSDATIHTDPSRRGGDDPHELTAHHHTDG